MDFSIKLEAFWSLFSNNERYPCDLFADVNYKLLKTIFLVLPKGSKLHAAINPPLWTSIFFDFTFFISPYQISKIERNLNFRLSQVPQISPLLQELALKGPLTNNFVTIDIFYQD